MKRTFIAWTLSACMVLGAVPTLAAAPARDLADYNQVSLPLEEEDAVAANAGAGPTQSIVSVSGGLVRASDGETGATPKTGAAPKTAGDAAPVAENQEIETYRGVSVGGQLSAHDPDGDELTFEIATEPMKGSVQLRADGRFVYTPEEGKRGKDYFGFRAMDGAGNTSQEGTVIIRLVKQKSEVTYSDMTGNGSEYAAVVLTEKGVFTGENVSGEHLFRPDDEVSRGEFLSMCMTAAGKDLLRGVSSTGFQDDGDIGPWLKPCVATALMNGYIQGQPTDTGATFSPDEPITLQEACVTLNAVLGVTNVVSAAAYVGEENSGANWAQAVANLTACGVMPDAWDDVEAVLTRSGAAELLANAIGLITSR